MSFDQIDLQWFAAEDEGRTEDPSEIRLRKAREEGRVAKSQDLNTSLVFLFALLTLILLGKSILSGCADIFAYFFNHVNDKNVKNSAYFMIFLYYFLRLVLPIACVGILFGVLGNVVQNRGWIFSMKAISFKFSKVVPKFGEYFKNTLFSIRGKFNIAKSIGKVFIIGVVAYVQIKKEMPEILFSIQNGNIMDGVFKVSDAAAQLLVIAAVIFLVLSIPDYYVQRREFMESMKMSKYDVKQEYKEMEGDPEVKGRLKQMQKELLSHNMPKAVREADVVITNPTHFAVSMKYDKEVNDAPLVTAKGEDEVALRMRAIATEAGVPVVENRPLARGLYAETEVGDIIPDTYLSVLANVYAEILKHNSKK